jgi:hypothetical protein
MGSSTHGCGGHTSKIRIEVPVLALLLRVLYEVIVIIHDLYLLRRARHRLLLLLLGVGRSHHLVVGPTILQLALGKGALRVLQRILLNLNR